MTIKTLIKFQKMFACLYENGLVGVQSDCIHIQFEIWVQFLNELKIKTWSVRENDPYITHSFYYQGIEFIALTNMEEANEN